MPDLYQATRTNKTLSFDPAAVIVALQTGNVERIPGLRPDGKLLYSSANPDSAPKGFDICRSARQGDGTFLGPTIAQSSTPSMKKRPTGSARTAARSTSRPSTRAAAAPTSTSRAVRSDR